MSSRTTWKSLVALACALAFVASACGGDGGDESTTDETEATSVETTEATTVETTEATTAETTESTAADVETTESAAGSGAADADLALSATDLGDILVDARGNTVYLFVPDDQGESTCYDQCEANWPIVGELSTVGDGLDASLLGTTERTTGDVQATYNGWPLYYFVNDTGPGETSGQGVNDVWYVLDADGNAVGG